MRVALIRTEYVIPVPKSLPSSLGVATIKHQKHTCFTPTGRLELKLLPEGAGELERNPQW